MNLVKPSYKILSIMNYTGGFNNCEPLKLIEEAGRTCYKSEDKITPDSSINFISKIKDLNHESVLEHSAMTVKFICDRGVSHELVRHRLTSFSQESTRYCNYKGGVTFVIPPWCNIEEGEYNINQTGKAHGVACYKWAKSMIGAESYYLDLVNCEDWTPQQARSVLPNSLKTEIVVTTNFREWRHIFKLRTAPAAHPQMRELMIPLLDKCKHLIPIIFDDIIFVEGIK